MTDLRIAKDRLLYMYSRLVDGKMLYKEGGSPTLRLLLTLYSARHRRPAVPFYMSRTKHQAWCRIWSTTKSSALTSLYRHSRNLLSNEEVFATLKILLESRAFTKKGAVSDS